MRKHPNSKICKDFENICILITFIQPEHFLN